MNDRLGGYHARHDSHTHLSYYFSFVSLQNELAAEELTTWTGRGWLVLRYMTRRRVEDVVPLINI